MFDTLLGIIGLGYSYYSASQTRQQIDALSLQISAMREAISIMQREISTLFSDARMLRDVNSRVDESIVHEISFQLFRRLEELQRARRSSRLFWYMILETLNTKYKTYLTFQIYLELA